MFSMASDDVAPRLEAGLFSSSARSSDTIFFFTASPLKLELTSERVYRVVEKFGGGDSGESCQHSGGDGEIRRVFSGV